MSLALTHPGFESSASPPACDGCGHTDSLFRRSLEFGGYPGRFDLWQCGSCNLVWNWPRLPAEAIGRQYDGGYYVFSSPPARRWSRALQLYLNHLHPLEHESSSRRLLEIGCARGELLALADARGWTAEGVEISAEAAEIARREHGLCVRPGCLEEHTDRIGKFDIAIATDVIEHVTSPRRFLLAIRSILKPGGVVIIETPNYDSPWRRLGGSAWLGFNRFHLYLFNAEALRTLTRRCGFADCRIGTTTNYAYAQWGDRPELARLLGHLPPGFRWRTIRWLNAVTPRSAAARLRRQPVASLEEAVHRVQKAANCNREWHPSSRLTGDNLFVRARLAQGDAPREELSCCKNRPETDPDDVEGCSGF